MFTGTVNGRDLRHLGRRAMYIGVMAPLSQTVNDEMTARELVGRLENINYGEELEYSQWQDIIVAAKIICDKYNYFEDTTKHLIESYEGH